MTREEWDSMLDTPLPGRAKVAPTPEQLAKEAEGFLSFLGQQGG